MMERRIDTQVIILALLSCLWVVGLLTGFLHPIQIVAGAVLETSVSWTVAFSLMGFATSRDRMGTRVLWVFAGSLAMIGPGLMSAAFLLGSEFGVDTEGGYTIERANGINHESLAMCASLAATYLFIFFDRKRRLKDEGLGTAALLLIAPPAFAWFVSLPMIGWFSLFVGAIVHEIVRPTLHVLLKLAGMGESDDARKEKLKQMLLSATDANPLEEPPRSGKGMTDSELYSRNQWGSTPSDRGK